jgi:regulator of sigma E protease
LILQISSFPARSLLALALPGIAGPLLLLVVGIACVIFVHELGHFLIAKWRGVRVIRFAVGYGKELVGFTRGQTRYSINMLPLGGYVQMLGREDFDVDTSGEMYIRSDPLAFSNKPVGQRMMIVSAGVVMNLLFACFLFMVAFLIGMDVVPAAIGIVQPDSPAWRAGLAPGARILSVNGRTADEWTDVLMAMTLSDPDKPLEVRVLQQGHEETVSLEPDYGAAAGMRHVGIGSLQSMTVAYVEPLPGAPPEGQMEAADEIIALRSEPVKDIHQVLSAISAARGEPVELTVKRSVKDKDGNPVLDGRGKPVTRQVNVAPRARITMSPASSPNLLGAVPHVRAVDAPQGRWIEETDLVVAKVLPDTPMGKAGLVDGARLLAVNGKPVADWFGLIEILRANNGKTVSLTSQTDSGSRTGDLAVPRCLALELGLAPWPDGMILSVAGHATVAVPGSDGQSRELGVCTWPGARAALSQNVGRRVEVEYLTGGVRHSKSVLVSPDMTDPWTLRIAYPATFVTYPQMTPLRVTNPVKAMWLGIKRTGDFLVQTYMTTRQLLFTQQVGAEQLSGPVGILRIGAQVAAMGSAQLIYFLAFLSVNFALVNSLPFPIVDGGHFFFLIIEKIRGKALSVRTQMTTQGIGLAIVFVGFIFLTIQDVLLWHKG